MPRKLASATNELKIYDNISSSDILFRYRTPTTKERTAYSNKSFQRKRNKILTKQFETRIEFGLKILEGFRDGDFVIPKNGKNVPIASDSGSENYDPDWKKHIEAHAIDLVALLAAHVFEGPAEIDQEEDPGTELSETGEDAEKNLSEI